MHKSQARQTDNTASLNSDASHACLQVISEGWKSAGEYSLLVLHLPHLASSNCPANDGRVLVGSNVSKKDAIQLTVAAEAIDAADAAASVSGTFPYRYWKW